MLGVDGVASVHDLHVWTITSGIDALSAHVVVADGMLPPVAATVVDRLAAVLRDEFKLDHSTIQVEPASRKSAEMQL